MLAYAAPAQARCLGACSGASSSSATAVATSYAMSSAQQATVATQQAMNSLSRAIQSMQAMQTAARNLALGASGNVPNGLALGGLVPDSGLAAPGIANPVSTWIGANTPTQSTSGSQILVSIQQTAPQAILNWQSFNVSTNTTVDFNQQGNAGWVALNRIAATGVPSQIFGSIRADGQVYLINPNGIIFGGASQVNVGALIASSASITANQFLANGIYSTQSGSTYAPSFTNAGGAILVQPGAQITTATPSSVTAGGGFVLLMGSEVQNAGTIVTPDGQTALAAGDSFVLRPGYSTISNTTSTTRGNEIAPLFNAGSSSGTVGNSGLIYSQQGDITLAGHTVTQDGLLISTTSVNQRGTIHLLNSASDAAGSVTLTGNALTAIVPETADAAAILSGINPNASALNSQRDALIADSATQNATRGSAARGQFDNLSLQADREDQSRIEIVTGGIVDFQNGSLTQAQGGQVAVSAVQRVFVESGASIDVSGTIDTLLPMSANNIAVNVQGNELRDSPQNRDGGYLLNSNIWIDARNLTLVPAGTGGYASDRYYTAGGLLEVSGWLNNTPHMIGEWTALGGQITLATGANGAVVAQPGSIFNISGGAVQYQGGYLKQTYLIGSNGRIYTADTAPAGLTYSGIFGGFSVDHAHWGVTQIYWPSLLPQQRYEPGYTVGRDAGSLILSTPTALFEGGIIAGVIDGARQVNPQPAGVTDGYKLTQNEVPLAGTLALGQYTSNGLAGAYTTDVVFGDVSGATGSMSAASPIPSDRVNTAWFDAPTLASFGLAGLNINSADSIQADAPLNLANGGQVTFAAPHVAINADITAHSGSVSVSNILNAATGTTALTNADGGAQLTLAAAIDASGVWVNGTMGSGGSANLAFLNGGNVTFDSTQNLTLASGSLINVSSGGAILANGKTQGGKGGSVTIKAGDAQQNAASVDSTLILDGIIRGYGVTGGNTLTISSPGNILIGNNAELAGGVLPAGTPAPVALKLMQALTIPAGEPLPTVLTLTFTSLVYDVPIPVAIRMAATPTTPTGADWIVPNGMDFQTRVNGSTQFYGGGDVLPAGSIITGYSGTGTTGDAFPTGTVIPSSVFPNGFPVQPYQVTYAAGSVQSTPMTYPVGSTIPAGAVLPQTVAIAPAPALNPSFFTAGFSSYSINGAQGVLVATGTVLAPAMPVYQVTPSSYAAPSGSDPSSAMALWTPPLFKENPVSATLTQRGGVSLTLTSQSTAFGGANLGGGSIVVGDGAAISVDPGQSITLNAFGQISVLGDLTAHGGSITLINSANGSKTDAARNFDAQGNGRGISIWVDANARLDVSGLADSASDFAGHRYGTALNGGAITINGGGAFVLIRPGAELDADGTQVAIDLAAGGGVTATSQPLTLASNGGSITLSSSSGLYLDGDMHAFAGGAGAAGGSLTVSLVTPSFVTQSFPNSLVPTGPIVPSTMVVTQAYQPSPLPSDIAPGTDAASLNFGQVPVSADKVMAGGFDSLTLSSGDYMQFSGNVSLSLGRSLTLTAAAFTSGPALPGTPGPSAPVPTGNVLLSAPYILLREPPSVVPDGNTSGSINNPSAAALPTTATFELDADQIDVQGLIVFSASAPNNMHAPGFATTKLVSQGDIRFLSTSVGQTTTFATDWNLDLDAAQIYPATGVVATVTAGQNNFAAAQANSGQTPVLSIGRTTTSIPAAPLSAFGSLALAAPIVEQGGIVRAPFGTIVLGNNNPFDNRIPTQRVDVLPGSLTSVSMNGLDIPYGGTVDGVTYNYNGASVTPLSLTDFTYNGVQSGIILGGQSLNVASGAVLDLSGGGMLSGAGFISGRGGSVNVLNTPLVNANPTTPISKAGDGVYAIVPGYAASYAPVAPENGAGNPVIGQQITIPSGVPGLPAGTYTLLPSNYALLPDAYRVEFAGSSTRPVTSPIAIGNGTYAASVSTGIANTAIKSSLPVTALITSGTAVRSYSQYNEESYSDFLIAKAVQFGGVRPLLPADGKALELNFETPSAQATSSALTFDGTALFQGAQGGDAGQVLLMNVNEIYSDPSTATFPGVSVDAASLNALNAPRLMVNGFDTFLNGTISFQGGSDIIIRDGVTLKAGEIFLVGGNISVGNDVTLTTIGQGAAPFDSDSTGMGYTTGFGTSVLALSNGNLDFLGAQGNGAITIGANSSLYSEGTLAFATNGASTIDPMAHFGSRNIALAAASINIGDDAAIAAAGAPTGFILNQALFNILVNGDPTYAAPALQKITLSAANSVNLFGSAGLDATGTGIDLVLNTPAIYGYGTASDHATIAAGKITWNGIPGATPPAISPGGPGTGAGTLDLIANEIDLGQFVSLDTTSPNRVIYGFSNVNLVASSQIVSAGNSTLYVYQSPSSDPSAVFGQSGVGGNLTLATPLLTGVQKSIIAYTVGGALNVVAPAGLAPSAAKSTVSGAEIDLSGDSVTIASTILLPSGKLVVNATNDISLNDGSRIDLSGQPSTIQTATVYGFGGTAIFNSAQGSLTQTAGSTIDVSATNANAGSITISARNGVVTLASTLNGAADNGYTSGDFSVTTNTLSDSGFAALNASLTQGGFFDARSFDIRNGDLDIGDGVKASNVTVSVDSGILTVNGTIDASGPAPGTIRLSAGNGLTLASTAVLDAHGNVLQTDSYGQPIEAMNRGHIELTAAGGTLTLSPGATMNLTTPDGVAYGDIQLNAQRTGETSGDIAIDALSPLNITGAYSIALNAFWTYNLPGGSVITQSTLDGYDVASTAFINAALANSTLQGRLTGLTAYGSAYHLRPGVQITSSGDLSTSGDIDLSGYRYGPNADRNTSSATYGAGEPMALVIRASGNLTVQGSISDGFQQSLATAPTLNPITTSTLANNTSLFGKVGAIYYRLLSPNTVTVMAAGGWTVPDGPTGIALPLTFEPQAINGTRYASGSVIPYGVQLKALYIPQNNAGAVVGLWFPIPGLPSSAATTPKAFMLAPGSLSASIRLVAGADLAAADQRELQATQALNGSGNLTLNDPAYNESLNGTYFSVLRTGTGSLDLLAGGSFSEATPYGVYTAGTQAAPILAADGSNPYDLVGLASGGGVHAWYPEDGGDVLLMAQQDVTGSIQIADNNTRYVDSDLSGNWLGRQGGTVVSSDPTSWWINFGKSAKTYTYASGNFLIGFQGIGTLGGGNLTVIAGGNAGVTGSNSTGLDLAVASTGRVQSNGTLAETGGGNLVLKVGGVLNPLAASSATSLSPDYFGSVTDLRGNITVNAGSVGTLAQNNYGKSWTSYDPRASDPSVFQRSIKTTGPIFTPGDGTVSIETRGDLVLGGAGDAGMSALSDINGTPYHLVNPNGSTTFTSSGGQTYFTLWTSETAINLFAAGGDVAALDGNDTGTYGASFYPGTLIIAAANGDIRFAEPVNGSLSFATIELMPSPTGQLELLAAGSIFGTSQVVAMSGAGMSTLATPANPVVSLGTNVTNASQTAPFRLSNSDPIAFGPDTPQTDLHAGDDQPALVYAGVDIVDLTLGQVRTMSRSGGFTPSPTTWYIAAKPFEVIAGRDIVGTGPNASVFLNNNANDISLVQAGRDIFYESVDIFGPGLLQVQAGRNLYQGYYGSLTSIGDIVNPSNTSGGAAITVLTGVGANGPDYSDFAELYFDPVNQLSSGTPLAGSGKVVHAYDQELLTWLQQRFGYKGTQAGALAFFLALPADQQGVFVRQVYYDELTAGGREYNDAASPRYRSYLRGREAIATLFPIEDANGHPVTYSGGLTMFSSITGTNSNGQPITSDAGIHTISGGNIQILDPGGQTLIGVEGVSPGANAGLITQGSGDIDIYSLGSILLGQSRIMTTFGGNILAWSATGDINAGRGSKTTTIFTPPKRVYGSYGNVTLSPTVPSAGAGIATLNPIPTVPPGNVDLIAPLGTIDAGEAGIRVSGNVNLAAVQVINAANIQVQGTSTGIPTVQGPPVAALTTSSNVAGAAQAAVPVPTNNANGQPSIIIVEVVGYGGGANDTPVQQQSQPEKTKKIERHSEGDDNYDPYSPVHLLGNGALTEKQKKKLSVYEYNKLEQVIGQASVQ